MKDEALVIDVAIEMHRKLGDPGDWTGGTNQMTPTRFVDHHAGDTEIPVEPRIVEDSSVDLDRPLGPATSTKIGAGGDSKSGGVGVRSGDSKVRLRSCDPGDQQAAPRHEASSLHTAREVDDLRESIRSETQGRVSHRMRRTHCGIKMTEQRLDEGGSRHHDWKSPIGRPLPRKCDVSFTVTMLRSPVRAAATRWIEV